MTRGSVVVVALALLVLGLGRDVSPQPAVSPVDNLVVEQIPAIPAALAEQYLERIAPLNNAGRIRKPVVAVVGKNDPRVPWTGSRQTLDKLKESGVPTWFLTASDEGHGFTKQKNQDVQFHATVMFVRRFLLGEDAPPGK